MNPVDLVVLVLLALGAISGARAGFFGPVLGLVGAVIGFGLALAVATVFREQLTGIEQPMRAVATLLGIGFLVLSGEAIGATLGTRMSHGMRRGPLASVDSLGGAVVGAGHVVLLVWLVGGMLAAGLAPWLGAAARESLAVRLATERLPSPLVVAGELLGLLDTTDLPPLFGGLEPIPAEPVDLPADTEMRRLAESAIASTARVAASGCGAGLSVGSAFFIGPAHAVTNAHVVAGSDEVTLTLAGGPTLDGAVVAFEPDADLALLHVPGASIDPLVLAASAPTRGATGVALGFPGGGDLTVTAAGVTNNVALPGPNIYGETVSEPRTLIELRAAIRRGNSGGPLVVEPGTVGAVIFGASRVNPDVGYAIGSDEVVERLGPRVGATAPVATGACL